jgi:hypothetical protein
MEKSDITADNKSARGPKIIPITLNVNGSESTPPPTTVLTRLKTDVFKLAVRSIVSRKKKNLDKSSIFYIIWGGGRGGTAQKIFFRRNPLYLILIEEFLTRVKLQEV